MRNYKIAMARFRTSLQCQNDAKYLKCYKWTCQGIKPKHIKENIKKDSNSRFSVCGVLIQYEKRQEKLGFGQNASEIIPKFYSLPLDYTYISLLKHLLLCSKCKSSTCVGHIIHKNCCTIFNISHKHHTSNFIGNFSLVIKTTT